MRAKLGAFAFCMVFAIPFGAVGVFATWGIVKMVRDSMAADDWVLVQAKVDEAALNASRGSKGGTTYAASGAYRYTVGGREYVSTRLGFDAWGGSDNVGDWHRSMASFMEEAKASGRTVPVFVDPDKPADAVVDRGVRWGMVAFMGLFGVLFGGVGVGALIGAGFVLFGKESNGNSAKKNKAIAEYAARRNSAAVGDRNDARIDGTGGGSVAVTWIVTLIWNAISWPAAYLAWPTIASGEWLAGFVFLFPLFGVLMLWGALSQAFTLFRRGRAALRLETLEPRMGTRLGGAITFPGAGRIGDPFDITLAATDADSKNENNGNRRTVWSASRTVPLVANPRGGSHLPFQIDIPARIAGDERAFQWAVMLKGPRDAMPFDTFPIRVGAPRGDVSVFGEPSPPPELARNARAMSQLFGAELAAKMPVSQQAALAELSPDTQQAIASVVKNRGTIKKILIGIAVMFVAWQLIAAGVAVFRTFQE